MHHGVRTDKLRQDTHYAGTGGGPGRQCQVGYVATCPLATHGNAVADYRSDNRSPGPEALRSQGPQIVGETVLPYIYLTNNKNSSSKIATSFDSSFVQSYQRLMKSMSLIKVLLGLKRPQRVKNQPQ